MSAHTSEKRFSSQGDRDLDRFLAPPGTSIGPGRRTSFLQALSPSLRPRPTRPAPVRLAVPLRHPRSPIKIDPLIQSDTLIDQLLLVDQLIILGG